MNEQAFKELYEEFKSTGYLGTEADFKILMSTNSDAFNDGFNQFTNTGYNGDADAFAQLIGVSNPLKKKEESDFISQDQDGGLVTEDISSDIPVYDFEKPQTEQDFFEGTFGDILRSFDKFTQTGLGDFIDDMARSAATGYYQGQVAEDASDILIRGANATDEDIYSFIEANKEAQKLGPSDEMMAYQKTYEENGKGFMGVIMGLYESGLQVIPEVIVSSMFSMATNKDSLVAAGTVLGAGATVGGTTGAAGGTAVLPVIGTVGGAAGGAIAGAAATLPYAFAAAGSVLEMGATFSELLQEEIEGELTPEKIREAINNEEIYTSIRNKALARGITIGVIDAFTGRLGSKVAGGILSKAGKGATKGTKIKSVLAASGVESVGGSIGESAGIGVTNIDLLGKTKGQEFDISEIALEGIAEAPGGIKDVISARFSKPKYKVNGKKVDVETIDNLIETMTLDQLQSTKIKIDNDYEGRADKLSDRILQLNTERLILDANPDINPETLSEITSLQLELNKLEGNKTEVAKEKASILKAKIKDLQENQLEAEVDTEVDAFRELEQSEQLKYIEQASKELVEESEAKGDEEFEITEQQNLQRAVELFNKDQQTETDTEVEVTSKEETEVKEERYKDSQIPVSQQKITYEDDNGETNIATVTTQLDGSRKLQLSDEEGTPFSTETISKDNTLTNEQYVTRVAGDIKTTEDVDIKTVINPKLESRMSDRQRKAAGMDVTPEAEVDVDDEVVYEMNKTNKKIWSKDFEILDNRQGQEQALFDEEGNKTSDKWWVVNKVTGQIIEVGTKTMAKDVIANAPAYAETFGDGTKVEANMLVTPAPAPAPKAEVKVEEQVEVETKVEPKTEQEIKARIKELEQVPSGMNAAMQAAKEGKPTNTPEIQAMQEAEISAKEEIQSLKEKLKQPKTDPEISRLENEIENDQMSAETILEEITIEQDNYKEEVARIKEEKAKIKKDKKLSKEQKLEAIEEKVAEQEDLKDERDGIIESYRDDLKQKKSEIRKAKKALEKITQKPRKQVTKVEKQIDNARKALNKLDKEIKIVVHNDDASYRKATGEDTREQSTRGEYNPATKTIHINATKVQDNTVAHEVFHALLLRNGITNKQAKAITDRMLKAVKKTASPELLQKLKEHSDNYDSALQSEESIAELFGILASEYKSLDKPTQNLVQRWVNKLAKILGVKKFTDAEVIDLLNVVSAKVEAGKEITEQDVEILEVEEQGGSGQVGTFTFKDRKQKAPNIKDDTRDYAKNIIQKDLQDYRGQNFITNMYDFTNAGPTNIGAGIVLDLYGGKNYVADMMEKTGTKLGEVSNVAAFNTKSQAEGFIKNSIDGNANLFAPHVGTKEGSWQFQQNIFEQLTEKLLDNNIITNQELIESFNDGLKSKNGQSALNIFNKKYKKNLTNLNEFKDNPKRLVELLDIDNNYSPDLRKILNDKIASNKKVQAALGVKNKIKFAELLEDPMNVGSQKFDIIGLVEFDNTTFKTPSRPKKGDADYHPSFAWTVKAKIKAIVQPTNFYQSTEVTDSYTKFNKSGAVVSTRENTKDFKSSNVSSSAGSGPKVATVKAEIKKDAPQSRKQKTKSDILKTLKEGQKLPTKPKQIKNKNGSITSGKVHLYHSTNGVENLNDILENGIDFEKQKAVGGLFFSKLGSPYRQDDSFVVIETDIENIPFNQRTEGQEVALGQISDYKIVHSSRMSPRELKTLSSLEMILNRKTNGGIEGYEKSLQNYKKRNKNSELVKYLEDAPQSRKQKTIQQAARDFNMSETGFFPPNADSYFLKRAISRAEGDYGVKKARTGSFFLVDSRGKKVNDLFKRPQSRKQIIGENAELSDNVRDNLSVAKQMEKAKKSAKTIRISTGWEKGADGKWRYEIDDIAITGDATPWTDEWKGEGYITKLNDLVSGGLIEAYPQLEKVTVVRGVSGDNLGTFGQMSKTREGWDINLSERLFNKDIDGSINFGKSVLLHEIQHVIQDIEGFAMGGNTKIFNNEMDTLSFGNVNALRSFARDIAIKNPEKGWDITYGSDAVKKYEEIFGEKPSPTLITLTSILDQQLNRGIDIDETSVYKTLKNNKLTSFEKYKRLVGEVEARNVQKRMGMTPKQRKETTLQETEDVAREDQILLFPDAPQSRKQIIGENADLTALNLSYGLNLAKDIESFLKLTPEQIEKGASKNVPIDIRFLKNKTPQELKLLTGWERGKDNKWRYEIPDGKLTLRESGTFKLSDIYDSKDLYKAYPQLKDMKVEVDIRPQGAVNAWFIPSDKSIEINAKPDSDVTSLLVHEIQHAIQFIEGFATGGNMVSAFNAYESTVTPEEKRAELELKEEVEVLRNLSAVLELASIDFEGMSLDEVLDLDFMKENFDVLGLEEVGDAVNVYEYVNVDNPQIINKLKTNEFGDSLDLEESFEEASFIAGEKQAEYSDKYSTYALYQRLTGEVESRNVEKRYGMREEKRRETLLEATEDVAREDQILLFPDAPQSRKQKPSGKRKPTRKRTSSIKKAITEIKNVLNITPDEQRKIFKALNDQKKRAKDIKKDIVASLRELTKEGKITPSKMVSVINKVPDDFNNPITVERFVEYMTKVFNNADYGNKMMIANAKKGKARKNASTKIGIAEGLVEQLQRLFSVKPSLIPDSVLDQYMGLINIFGKRESVLSLPSMEQVTNLTEDVLQQLDEEQSMAIELADRYENADKVMGDDGVDYAATIKQMLDNEVITEREYEVMKKYKSEIKPTEPATPKTEEEIEAERQGVIEDINETKEVDPSVFPSRLERDLAKRFKKLLKTDAVNDLSLDDLKNLFKVIDNINNGYLPHYAQIMVGKMNAINDAKLGTNAINRSKLLPLSKIYANLKSKFGRTGKSPTLELIRRNPTFYIDQVFGDFKTKDIFNSIFKRSAEASAKYTKAIKEVQAKIEKVEQAVFKSFGRNPNKVIMSKYKQMSYLIQQEFLSNPDSKQVNSVKDFLKATIKRIKTETTSYTETDAIMLQEILDKYTDNGKKPFDIDQLYESFNVAERNSIRTLEEINKSMTDKAVYTANIIRGNKITPLKNYTHLSVIPDVSKADIIETETSQISDMFNKYLKPSTKAKSLIERTGKVSSLNFDVYASVQRGAKYTLMDFNLTEPIRTARRTLNQIEKNLSDEDGNMSVNDRRKFNAIRDASVESIENLLSNALTQNTIADQAVDYIQKQGYRAILAGIPRASYELLSNILAGIYIDPKGIISGIKNRKLLASPEGKEVMNNLNSTQTNRVFSTGLSGKFVDTGILNQAAGVTASRAKGRVKNTILQLWNKTGQRWIKGVEFTADSLISAPDKLVMQPMWFGAFENRFKQLTGKSPDFDKIAANDEAYMNKYATELNDAKTLADNRSVAMGATDNAFMGILKGTVKPNQGILLRGFNAFNGFMTRFLIFEYITARTGIMAAVGNGQVSKKQGAALLAGVTTRMIAYTFMGTLVAEAIKDLTEDDDDEDFDFSNFQFEDNDEQGMKSVDKMLGQAMVSAFTSLLFGRDFGNATKSIINLGLENLNEAYGQFLRDGDYDKYRDAIQYTIIPEGKSGRPPQFADIAPNLFAAYSPMIKTLEFGINKLFESDRVQPDAIERQQDERFIRLPLETFGVLGFIPFYKDIRKIVLGDMYKGLRKAKKDAANKKKRKAEMLQGYSSETDMKRYDFPLWERTFGPDSPGYETRQAEKELKRKARKLRQQEKDKMYDYTPSKKKRRKQSSPFGPSSNRKGSSPFGPN